MAAGYSDGLRAQRLSKWVDAAARYREGDTLAVIAKRYRVKPRAVAEWLLKLEGVPPSTPAPLGSVLPYCAFCGEDLPTRRGASGRPRKYCSNDCRGAVRDAKRADQRDKRRLREA